MNSYFEIRIDAPGFSGRPLVGDLVTKFIYEERMTGCATWGLQIATHSAREFQGIAKDDGEPIKLSFGSVNPQSQKISDQKSLRVLHFSQATAGTNREVMTFRGMCNGVRLLQHRSKDKVWKDKKISEIVEELVKDAGLQPDVKETEGKFTLTGRNENTARLIGEELLPLAYSNAGQDWHFWVKDGQRVVFSPPKLEKFEYKFTNSNRSDWVTLIRPVTGKDLRAILRDRAGKVEVQAFDSHANRLYRKEVGESESKFNYAGGSGPKAKSDVAETRLINILKDRHTDVQTQKVVERVANNLWSQNARSLYYLASEVDFTPGLTINRMCQVDITGPSSDNKLFNGPWLTYKVRHAYINGKGRSWVVLVKRWER